MAKKAKKTAQRSAQKKSTTARAASRRAAGTGSKRPVTGGGRGAARQARKYVYFFGNGKAEGDRSMREVLGGKGAGLAEMTNAGLPVPPGFTISTAACNIYYAGGGKLPPSIDAGSFPPSA